MGSQQWVKPLLYAALNIASASGIVFANKAVFQTYQFRFTCALTWVHTVFTLLGMRLFLALGMFERKDLPPPKVLPLAAAFVAYIVLCNLSLNLNPISFYQVMKIAVAPTVLALELVLYSKRPTPKVVASVMLVCVGVAAATITDPQMAQNMPGLMAGVGATLVTATFQIWVGTKQRELRASSMQLLHQYTPQAALMLSILVPLMEPVGWRKAADAPPPGPFGDGTILGYHYTPPAVIAIVLSAGLGLLVSLSTFLVIGATSSLTYNVVGHLKTVIILTGGCVLFGDTMPPKKLLGVGVAMLGIVWYTQLQLAANELITRGSSDGSGGGDGGKGGKGGDAGAPLLPVTATALDRQPSGMYNRAASNSGGGAAAAAAAGAAAAGTLGSVLAHEPLPSSPLRGRGRGA
ncbi:MAG: triose-phosphate transporter family-domain-containing protein [Monoraphidium minutum]|nr:MAG: triose-phosphate transporter family-domain-containing protein [Monoraphidium minutum]